MITPRSSLLLLLSLLVGACSGGITPGTMKWWRGSDSTGVPAIRSDSILLHVPIPGTDDPIVLIDPSTGSATKRLGTWYTYGSNTSWDSVFKHNGANLSFVRVPDSFAFDVGEVTKQPWLRGTRTQQFLTLRRRADGQLDTIWFDSRYIYSVGKAIPYGRHSLLLSMYTYQTRWDTVNGEVRSWVDTRPAIGLLDLDTVMAGYRGSTYGIRREANGLLPPYLKTYNVSGVELTPTSSFGARLYDGGDWWYLRFGAFTWAMTRDAHDGVFKFSANPLILVPYLVTAMALPEDWRDLADLVMLPQVLPNLSLELPIIRNHVYIVASQRTDFYFGNNPAKIYSEGSLGIRALQSPFGIELRRTWPITQGWLESKAPYIGLNLYFLVLPKYKID